MKLQTQDISIGYFGASGGFLLLHLLLLSEQYHANFGNIDFEQAFATQWQISSSSQWKTSESWPINELTAQYQGPVPKIYFYCGPDSAKFSSQLSRKIFLYTDIASQIALAEYKSAFWRHQNSNFSLNKNLLKQWNQHYNQLKDPAWPKCLSWRHIYRLPQWLQDELLQDAYTRNYIDCQNWKDWITKSETKSWQQSLVYAPAVDLMSMSDTCIQLQDLVNSYAKVLVDCQLLHTVNQRQIDFISTWKKLHTGSLLRQIGIKDI